MGKNLRLFTLLGHSSVGVPDSHWLVGWFAMRFIALLDCPKVYCLVCFSEVPLAQ